MFSLKLILYLFAFDNCTVIALVEIPLKHKMHTLCSLVNAMQTNEPISMMSAQYIFVTISESESFCNCLDNFLFNIKKRSVELFFYELN